MSFSTLILTFGSFISAVGADFSDTIGTTSIGVFLTVAEATDTDGVVVTLVDTATVLTVELMAPEVCTDGVPEVVVTATELFGIKTETDWSFGATETDVVGLTGGRFTELVVAGAIGFADEDGVVDCCCLIGFGLGLGVASDGATDDCLLPVVAGAMVLFTCSRRSGCECDEVDVTQ